MPDQKCQMPKRQPARRRTAFGVLLGLFHLAAVPLLSGCPAGAIGYMITPEPMTTVPAEYTGLPGNKLVIIVLTRESTDFADRDLAADLSAHVQSALEQQVRRVSFVSRSQVQEYQRTHVHWSDPPAVELGKRFGADMVLTLSVDEYSLTRQGDMFYQQGRLTCRAQLLDLSRPRGHEEVWVKDKLSVAYPPKEYGRGISADAQRTRRELLRGFAEKLSLCFVRHKVPTYAERD